MNIRVRRLEERDLPEANRTIWLPLMGLAMQNGNDPGY